MWLKAFCSNFRGSFLETWHHWTNCRIEGFKHKLNMDVLLQETLVAECDLGRDYEHCLELQKKVNDTETVSKDVLSWKLLTALCGMLVFDSAGFRRTICYIFYQ